LFTLQKFKFGQTVLEQGHPVEKVCIVLEGDFELSQLQQQKVSEKEKSQQLSKFLLEQRKYGEHHYDVQVLRRLAQKEVKHKPMQVPISLAGRGVMLGHKDAIQNEAYSCSVKCKSAIG